MQKFTRFSLFLLLMMVASVASADVLYKYDVTEIIAKNTETDATGGKILFGADRFEESTVAVNGYGYKLDGNAVAEGTNTKYVLCKLNTAIKAGDVISIKGYAVSGSKEGQSYNVASDRANTILYYTSPYSETKKNEEAVTTYTVPADAAIIGATELYINRTTSSLYFTGIEITGTAAAPSLVGENILGTASISWVKDNWGADISGQCTFIKFNYPDADESKYYRKRNDGVTAELYEGENLIETSTFAYDWDLWQNGAKFNTILDPSKTYTVKFAEGCWYMSSDEEGENKIEVSPAKTFTIEATTGGGGNETPSATAWDFTSVTPAAGKVTSLNKITVKAQGIDFSSVTGMTKGVIKCAETDAVTNVFFMATWDGSGLEASFAKISADGTYTLTIAEDALKINGNPNNEFTATWTIGEVAPPTPEPVTTTLSLDAATATLTVGDTKQLTATSNVTALIAYESSNTEVAIVDETGLVRAIGAGTATITASIAATDDYTAASATCEVTVEATASTEPFASITIGSDVIELSETEAIELENYPAGAVIKVMVSDEAIKMARYEILDKTTDEIYKSFADMTKGDGFYYCEMPREYGMAAGHEYAIHVWFRNSMSSFSGQTLYEYNFLVNGTNKNVPVLSVVSEYESVAPTEDFVLTGVTGYNTIDVRFKGEAPASATAWSTLEQGIRMNLSTEIVGNTVKVTVPNNAISHGVLVLFVQAKDAEGHIIGGGDQSVNPNNGALSWSWSSEVGCEMPQMLEAGTTVDELKTVTFKASDVLSLHEGQLVKVGEGEYIRRYNQLQVMDKLGNVIVGSVTASQYSESGNNIVLTLNEGIIEAGEYTIVLPYGAFLIGEEYAAASNASGTYVVTVTGNLVPAPKDILGEAVLAVTDSKITITFPEAEIPEGITDGEISLPGGVIINTPDGTEDTEKYANPDAVVLPATDGVSFTFNNPCGANVVVTIPAGGIQVIDYTNDYFGKVIYSNSEAITLSGVSTGIASASALSKGVKVVYNLAGQKVGANAKGIVIINGAKVLKQ